MPLCFNLFGKLRKEPAATAKVLHAVLGLDIAVVEEVLVEHAPPGAKQVVGDRTAFDAFVRYTTSTGASGFLGVETKYTEPFSPTSYPADRYETNPAFRAACFHPGAAARLAGSATNQLLRNTLLAAATRHTDGYDHGHAVVIAGHDDRTAHRAVTLVRAELTEPNDRLRSVSLERLIEHCQLEPRLAAWAQRFRQRYLDLSPIAQQLSVRPPPRARRVVPLSAPARKQSTLHPASTATDPAGPQLRRISFDEQVDQLAAYCHATLGDLTRLLEPAGYPNSLALCALEAIWSIGVRYSGVRGVISRYRLYRRRQGGDPDSDSLQDLLTTIDQVGASDGFAELVDNRQRTSSRGGIPKAAAVTMAARALASQGVDSTPDLLQAVSAGQAEQLKRVWRAVPGQRSGISWRYLLMLAGIPEVKPDRMICRFVADALQLAQVTPRTAADLVKGVAELPPMVPLRALDHAIWSYQRSVRPTPTSSP
jgi:hypothetical protein